MKNILLFIAALLISINSYSRNEQENKKNDMKGVSGFASESSVQVQVENNTVTTTFNKDVDNVTITVKKKSTNQVVSNQRMDAKQFDTVPVRISNYKEGDYSIEISSPEGELEGDF